MSDSINPYESPKSDIAAAGPAFSAGSLNETMLRYLKEASPWLRFVGILGFIMCGFMAVGGIVVIFTAPFLTSLTESVGSSFGVAAAGASMGVLYIIMAVIFFFPAKFVYFFGVKIRNYLQNNSDQELELALKNNKSLWKFYGIVCIIYLAIIPIFIIIAIAVGISSAFM
ncbi:hypothetical protein [Breznakiella homolactica]|uniref:DUF5362 domain-containing protein n=1 Tax=Breznakiella homolactica TaxID=2798577 RepID=A0A7T7XQ58_9SPIR|nr:hypothetical protein [Breznakiella homolactica]QQO10484.1 hypothetical protein JFL75_06095 [Breznakiella homolactica]